VTSTCAGQFADTTTVRGIDYLGTAQATSTTTTTTTTTTTLRKPLAGE